MRRDLFYFADNLSTGELHLYADNTSASVIGDTTDNVNVIQP